MRTNCFIGKFICTCSKMLLKKLYFCHSQNDILKDLDSRIKTFIDINVCHLYETERKT